MTGRVFVVQRPAFFDRRKRGWVNKYDLSPAREHGSLEFLLPPSNVQKDQINKATELMRDRLSDYGDMDHIMAVGDPVAIALAVMVAAGVNDGRVSVLKWDRITESYEPYPLKMGP